jgi:hypothetical protein
MKSFLHWDKQIVAHCFGIVKLGVGPTSNSKFDFCGKKSGE